MFEYTARVIRVIDGDTLELDIDLGFRTHQHVKARLAGVDAPEMRTAEGRTARNWLTEQAGNDVLVHTEKDRTEKYGRYLVWIWASAEAQVCERDTSINLAMVDAGMARLYTGGKRT